MLLLHYVIVYISICVITLLMAAVCDVQAHFKGSVKCSDNHAFKDIHTHVSSSDRSDTLEEEN